MLFYSMLYLLRQIALILLLDLCVQVIPARNVAHIRLFNGHTLGAAQVLFVFGR